MRPARAARHVITLAFSPTADSTHGGRPVTNLTVPIATLRRKPDTAGKRTETVSAPRETAKRRLAEPASGAGSEPRAQASGSEELWSVHNGSALVCSQRPRAYAWGSDRLWASGPGDGLRVTAVPVYILR